MDTNLGANDPYFAQAACSLLANWHDSDRINEVADLVDSFLGMPSVKEDYPEQGGYPRIGMAAANGVSLFMILGATEQPTVANAVNGWLERREFRSNFGFTSSFEIGARAAIILYEAFRTPIQPRVIVLGYSVGGAIGLALGGILANEPIPRTVSVMTFGQPKAGDDRMALGARGVDYGAWWNEGDNIRFCPPSGREAYVLHLLLSRLQSTTVNQLVQVNLATKISNDPVTLSAELPGNEGGPFTDLSIANFLRTNDAPTAIDHSLAEYNRRLGLWTLRNPPPPFRPRAATNIQQPAPVMQQMAQVPMPVLPREVTVADLPPRAPKPVVAPLPYRAVKAGKVWTVEVAGGTVYIGSGKQDAKRFAARMNSAYTHWSSAKAGDGPALANSVATLFPS